MVTDLLADTLTRIRNAQRIGHKSVRVESSKVGAQVLAVLKEEGFITYCDRKLDHEGKWPMLEVGLKYYSSGEPMIGQLKRVSRSGRRVYAGVEQLPLVARGLGISIVSTSQGILSDREARKRKIGGEVLALVS
jgi:small subunit ribosomal protein S8